MFYFIILDHFLSNTPCSIFWIPFGISIPMDIIYAVSLLGAVSISLASFTSWKVIRCGVLFIGSFHHRGCLSVSESARIWATNSRHLALLG